MQSIVIRHKLDLVIMLIDTTTGTEIQERKVRFKKGADYVNPFSRGDGSYVFINSGREDFDLQVEVYGYEKMTVPVRYEELNEKTPVKEVFLIPSENNRAGERVLTYSGNLSGLQAVDAVLLGQARVYIKEFDTRKRIMTLFRQGSLSLENGPHGIIHMEGEEGSFEAFEVEKMISSVSVKIKEPLERPFSGNDPINRIIFGKVTPEGNYFIRVRDNANELKGIVRYTFEDDTKFQIVDFHHSETPAEWEVM